MENVTVTPSTASPSASWTSTTNGFVSAVPGVPLWLSPDAFVSNAGGSPVVIVNTALELTPATEAEIRIRPEDVGVKSVSANPDASVRGRAGLKRPVPIVVRNVTLSLETGASLASTTSTTSGSKS